MSAKVSPQILLRLRPRIVGLDEGRGWWGLLSRSLFRGFAAKPRATLGIEGELVVAAFYPLDVSHLWRETSQHFGHREDWVADLDGLERYGCKREVVVGVVLFHKLIETECHIDWNVQDLALFAKVFVA